MKKSNHVPAALLMTVAAVALSGCNRRHYDYSREVRRCVDDKGRVYPDYECENRRTYRPGSYYSYPNWVYGGTQSSDGRLRNYRTSPTAGNEIVTSSGRVITRGGFGGSSSGRSGGGFFSGWGS